MEAMPTWGLWAILGALLLVRGLFAAMEAALQALSDERIKELAKDSHRARRIQRLRADPEATAASIRLALVLSGFIAVGAGGLVVPRQAPFAFLRMGSAAWLDRVALKTGTMDDPHSVCGVAGYLRKKDGGWIAFTTIVNGGPRMKHVPLYKAMEAIRNDVDALLARY